MAKALVIYYSRSGNTQLMAETITEAMIEANLPTDCKKVDDVSPDELLEYDAIVIGSPTYYGEMAGQIKLLIDESVSKHGKLDGKVGAAFSSSVNIGGGNETTITGILNCLLVHGMIIQGDPQGDHYGVVSIGKPNEKTLSQCQRKAQRIAQLTFKVAEK